jgi:hypothetical protein
MVVKNIRVKIVNKIEFYEYIQINYKMTVNTTICWEEFGRSIRSKLLTTGEETVFKIGDTITFNGRPAESPRVIITEFTGKDPNGPMGMCYLPWRSERNDWGTAQMTFRGNPRHIICYPVGNMHYGLHIDWATAKHMEPIDLPVYTNFVNKLIATTKEYDTEEEKE